MKKIFYYISAAILTFGLASCAKEQITPEEPSVPEVKGQITIEANIGDEAISKTTLEGNDQTGYKIFWSEGDKIKFYIGEPVKEYFTYTLTEGAGTMSGKFTGPAVPEEVVDYTAYAVYGENLTYGYVGTLAQEQYYTPTNSAASFPMAAKATISNGEVTLSDFKNIGGLLRLELKGSGTVKNIKLTADQPISGGIVRINEDGGASIQPGFDYKYVTLNCGQSGVELTSEAKPFYISLLSNDYTGVKIEVSDFSGHTCTKTLRADKALNIARAQITPASFTVTGLTNDNVPLTWDSPVGARGTLDGRECIVLDLGGNVGKVAIATKNIGASRETDYGTYYTWTEAANAQRTESWGKGWHLPTHEEIEALDGYRWPTLVETDQTLEYKFSETSSLIIPLGGFYDTDFKRYEGLGQNGDFWGEEIIGLNPEMDVADYLSYSFGFMKTTGYASCTEQFCRYKLPVRPLHKLPMTSNTPVGMKARIGDRDAMPVELNMNGVKKKVAVAIKNEGANTENIYCEINNVKYQDCFGDYYTYAEAEALCTDDWYIPSKEDIQGLWWGGIYQITVPKGEVITNVIWDTRHPEWNRTLKINVEDKNILYFPATGGGALAARGFRSFYWTSTLDPDYGASQQYSYQYVYGSQLSDLQISHEVLANHISVRLFHDIPR